MFHCGLQNYSALAFKKKIEYRISKSSPNSQPSFPSPPHSKEVKKNLISYDIIPAPPKRLPDCVPNLPIEKDDPLSSFALLYFLSCLSLACAIRPTTKAASLTKEGEHLGGGIFIRLFSLRL